MFDFKVEQNNDVTISILAGAETSYHIYTGNCRGRLRIDCFVIIPNKMGITLHTLLACDGISSIQKEVRHGVAK